MGDWASAIAQGVGAAANTGAAIMGDQIKNDQTLQMQRQLEQQAADIKLDTAQRMAAAEQMMKNAALQRYAAVVKGKMGEQVEQDAPDWKKTGLTESSLAKPGATASAADGADDEGDDESDSPATPAPVAASAGSFTSFTGDAGKIAKLMGDAQGTLKNPKATPEQKQAAQAVIDGLTQQIANQNAANKASVQGKTRARTMEEAVDAANNEALQNDPEAYVAGTTAYNNANKDDMAEKRLKQQAQIEAARGERQLDIERMREQGRVDAILAKLGGADGTGAGGSKQQANVAQIEYLMKTRGLTQDKALAYVYGNGEAAHKSVDDRVSAMASSLISNGQVRVSKDDPPGTNVASKALKMAREALLVGGSGGGMLDAAGGSVPNPLMPQGGAPAPAIRPPLSSFRK